MQDIVQQISNNKRKGQLRKQACLRLSWDYFKIIFTHKSSSMIVNIPKYILIDWLIEAAHGREAILVRTLPCQRVVTVGTKCHSAQLQNVKRMKIWVNNLTPFISAAISVTLFSNITQIYQMLPNLWHFFVFRSPRFPGSPSCRCRPCSTARGGSTPAILDKGLDQKALKPNFQHYHHKARAGRISSSLSSSSQLLVFDILVIINALLSFLSLSCLIIDHHHHLHLWIDPRGSERWRSPRAGRRCTRIEHRPRSGQDQVNSK